MGLTSHSVDIVTDSINRDRPRQEICRKSRKLDVGSRHSLEKSGTLTPNPSRLMVMVETSSSFDGELQWTPEARVKFKNIPFFARTQARQSIERLARAEEVEVVTAELVDRARIEFGQ